MESVREFKRDFLSEREVFVNVTKSVFSVTVNSDSRDKESVTVIRIALP